MGVKAYPILYVGRLEDKLTEFVHANGDYLFIVFAFFCVLAIVWLLSRQRKSSPLEPSSAQTRAIIGTMLASPDLSSDADGGRARFTTRGHSLIKVPFGGFGAGNDNNAGEHDGETDKRVNDCVDVQDHGFPVTSALGDRKARLARTAPVSRAD